MTAREKAMLDAMRKAFDALRLEDTAAATEARKILSDAAWDFAAEVKS